MVQKRKATKCREEEEKEKNEEANKKEEKKKILRIARSYRL